MRKSVRNAARAVIIDAGRLLAITMRDHQGDYYILPGGGQRHGETLTETLLRECREEIGCTVEVGELLYLREYIGKNHTFAHRHSQFHQLESVFHCTLPDPAAVRVGPATDPNQVGVAWLELERFDDYRFYPVAIKPFFSNGRIAVSPLYLGDMN